MVIVEEAFEILIFGHFHTNTFLQIEKIESGRHFFTQEVENKLTSRDAI